MCGIAGFLTTGPVVGADELVAVTRAMNGAIAHRGPDADDVWVDDHAGIALGHRRLAIIDLSDDGRQPMLSPSGRYRIAQNGEIYNYRELRDELASLGSHMRTQSDTEVLLGAIEAWGVERALQKVNGMFAFALWDIEHRTLTLARDRFGEKPLYFGWTQWLGAPTLYFASELAALRQHPGFDGTIDRQALALFLRHSYIPAPFSIFKSIAKVPPASFVVIDPSRGPNKETTSTFWSAIDTMEEARAASTIDPASAVDELDLVLRRAVKARTISDVPLGAFLSGGVDSSLFVALMQAQQTDKVRTFSIGFFDKAYDEAQDASRVAAHLGTEHTDLYVTAEEAQAVVPSLPQIYSEPFADSSQIPTYLVSKMARRHVTVSLSGDGGDELFGGYNRYQVLQDIWPRIERFPISVRRSGRSLISHLPAVATDRWLERVSSSRFLPAAGRRTPGAKLRKFGSILGEPTVEAAYRVLTSTWTDPCHDLLSGVTEPIGSTASGRRAMRSAADQAMAIDTVTYLPVDILAKVDRAAMAVALETRVPFLDPEVLRFAWSLPGDLRLGSGGKPLLRNLLARYVPTELTDRPKMGFGVPLSSWLRGPLKEWGDDLLQRASWLDQSHVRSLWNAHQCGRQDASHQLWTVLVACQWSEATSTLLDG